MASMEANLTLLTEYPASEAEQLGLEQVIRQYLRLNKEPRAGNTYMYDLSDTEVEALCSDTWTPYRQFTDTVVSVITRPYNGLAIEEEAIRTAPTNNPNGYINRRIANQQTSRQEALYQTIGLLFDRDLLSQEQKNMIVTYRILDDWKHPETIPGKHARRIILKSPEFWTHQLVYAPNASNARMEFVRHLYNPNDHEQEIEAGLVLLDMLRSGQWTDELITLGERKMTKILGNAVAKKTMHFDFDRQLGVLLRLVADFRKAHFGASGETIVHDMELLIDRIPKKPIDWEKRVDIVARSLLDEYFWPEMRNTNEGGHLISKLVHDYRDYISHTTAIAIALDIDSPGLSDETKAEAFEIFCDQMIIKRNLTMEYPDEAVMVEVFDFREYDELSRLVDVVQTKDVPPKVWHALRKRFGSMYMHNAQRLTATMLRHKGIPEENVSYYVSTINTLGYLGIDISHIYEIQ